MWFLYSIILLLDTGIYSYGILGPFLTVAACEEAKATVTVDISQQPNLLILGLNCHENGRQVKNDR